MRQFLQIALGIMSAIGGFVDIGDLVFNTQAGATFGFQLSAAIGGGFAPIVATAMAGYISGTTGVSIMMIVLALITLSAALAARETRGGSLT